MVAFTGDMSYWPNEDAACGSRGGAAPVARRAPDLRFVVVGRRPGRRLRRSAARLGFTLTGAVPDVRPFLAHSALVVAPLRVAQGVPNKVLEAMAMAKAVVATPAAVAGLRVRPARTFFAADPDALARATSQALDPRFARAWASAPRARARRLCVGAQPAPAGPSVTPVALSGGSGGDQPTVDWRARYQARRTPAPTQFSVYSAVGSLEFCQR